MRYADNGQSGDGDMILEGLINELKGHEGLWIAAWLLTGLSYLLIMVARRRIFIKAGEKGWKAFIPFYGLFVSHHIIGMKHIWFILDVVFWVIEIVLDTVRGIPLWVEETFFSVAIIITIISEIMHIMKLCYCFTKSELFGIGLFVIPPLFSMILAYDGSEYNIPRAHREKALRENNTEKTTGGGKSG